jgi:hypothetical protein
MQSESPILCINRRSGLRNIDLARVVRFRFIIPLFVVMVIKFIATLDFNTALTEKAFRPQ